MSDDSEYTVEEGHVVSNEELQLRTENERLMGELEQQSLYTKHVEDDLAHHKKLLVEAKEALNFIYDDADFESLEEEARIYPVLMKVLAHINQALGETTTT